MTFEKEAVDAVNGNWDEILDLNSALERLQKLRRQSIEPGGEFGKSKVAWKVGAFCQTILYREVMLAEGCAVMWNERNVLGSILCARAIMETTAYFFDFATQLERFCKANDLKAIDDLVMNRSFGTRLKEWFGLVLSSQATNILSYIDKLDKLTEGARKHYDALSEFCHPNYLGHSFLFGTLNRETHTVALSANTGFRQDILHHIYTACCLIYFAEDYIDKINKLIPTIVKLSSSAP